MDWTVESTCVRTIYSAKHAWVKRVASRSRIQSIMSSTWLKKQQNSFHEHVKRGETIAECETILKLYVKSNGNAIPIEVATEALRKLKKLKTDGSAFKSSVRTNVLHERLIKNLGRYDDVCADYSDRREEAVDQLRDVLGMGYDDESDEDSVHEQKRGVAESSPNKTRKSKETCHTIDMLSRLPDPPKDDENTSSGGAGGAGGAVVVACTKKPM